jgi:molecular chaperone GrpE
MSKKENKEEKDTVLAEDVEKVAEDAAKEKVDEAKGTAADEGADKKAPDAKDAAAKAEADKAAKLQQQFVRLQADFANYKKRTAAEKLQISEVVKMDVITNILPVIDNFERALQVPQDKVADDVKSFIDGYEMIYKQLLGVLEKEGVTKIDAVGKPFDPNYHQAVMRVPSDEYDDDVVVEVLQEGYLLGDKTLRPAMVKVAFNG